MGIRQLPEEPDGDIQAGWAGEGVSLEESKTWSLPLSEPWLSHLKNGSDGVTLHCEATGEYGFASARSRGKLSQIKG